METGSLINSIYGQSDQPIPEVGMGATILMWTDRRAATVIGVLTSGRQIAVQEDLATRVDDNGMSDAQTYEYQPNPEAAISNYTLRRNGAWIRKGESMKSGQRLTLGVRDHHHDFSF